jgi:transcriptional regulator with XRE-family HTH domain
MQKIEVAFGKVVRKRRLELGLSQEDFADKAGIHRTYVSSIELGKVQVSIRIAEQLSRALESPLSRIWKQVEQAG